LRPEVMIRAQALEAAQAFARTELDKMQG